jgi:hypothetical protein
MGLAVERFLVSIFVATKAARRGFQGIESGRQRAQRGGAATEERN